MLRWAGAKRKLVPRLQAFWGDSRRYLEPFAGSACLFFALEPRRAILGDLNQDLIATYIQIRNNPDEVATRLKAWRTDSKTYYKVRDQSDFPADPITRAARFIYLNRLCFNGLYRTNKDGDFNVPYGAKRAGPMPDGRALREAAELLAKVKLVHGDFSTILEMSREGDFVYMDPPYRVASRRMFREYQPGEFSPFDLERLGDWLDVLARRKVRFVVTYADSREGRKLGAGFWTRRVQVRRNIAGFAEHRRKAYEILISNVPLQ